MKSDNSGDKTLFYEIVHAENEDLFSAIEELEAKVNSYIEMGWRISGSMAVVEKVPVSIHTPGQSWGVIGNEWHEVDMWVLIHPMLLDKSLIVDDGG